MRSFKDGFYRDWWLAVWKWDHFIDFWRFTDGRVILDCGLVDIPSLPVLWDLYSGQVGVCNWGENIYVMMPMNCK